MRPDAVQEGLERRVRIVRLPAGDVAEAGRAAAVMDRAEYDAEAGEACRGCALQRDAPALRDLAQEALAAETAGDDLGMVRWRGQVAEQDHANIGTGITNGDKESLASQIRPVDDRLVRERMALRQRDHEML